MTHVFGVDVKIPFVIVFIVANVFLSSCDDDSEQNVISESVEFTSLYKTTARGGEETTLEGISKTYRVFYSQAEFDGFIQRFPFFLDILNQLGQLPDQSHFEDGAVIMAFFGEQSSGGYDIEIANVNRTTEGYALVSIQSEIFAPECPQDGALTYPMHLIHVPQRMQFVFEEELSIYSC